MLACGLREISWLKFEVPSPFIKQHISSEYINNWIFNPFTAVTMLGCMKKGKQINVWYQLINLTSLLPLYLSIASITKQFSQWISKIINSWKYKTELMYLLGRKKKKSKTILHIIIFYIITLVLGFFQGAKISVQHNLLIQVCHSNFIMTHTSHT